MTFRSHAICLLAILIIPNMGFPQDDLNSLPNTRLSDIQSYEAQIVDLESAYGPMDTRGAYQSPF